MENLSRTVSCLDGGGAMGMHMGDGMAVGLSKSNNFLHMLINNGVHDSVGLQPTACTVWTSKILHSGWNKENIILKLYFF